MKSGSITSRCGMMIVSSALALMVSASPASSQPLTDAQQTDEIVVTAQRSGIPVWRVTGAGSTVIMVGSIKTVAKGTRWNPDSLERALLRADRIMFPETTAFRLGVGPALSAFAKWKKQATLPQGQTLQSILAPDQFARLVALQKRGLLKPGFERRHPYHLARSLGSSVSGKLDPNADVYVQRVAKKNSIKMLPLARGDARALINQFFAMPPATHVACLSDAIALAEAGRGAVQARSEAWAAKRVPDVLNSVASRMERSCFPEGTAFERNRRAGLVGVVQQALRQPQVTVAVISLDSLARPGGILDSLKSTGLEVVGPRWR